jgi:energy-coupling factor transporter ATP-binding protein EcfA2
MQVRLNAGNPNEVVIWNYAHKKKLTTQFHLRVDCYPGIWDAVGKVVDSLKAKPLFEIHDLKVASQEAPGAMAGDELGFGPQIPLRSMDKTFSFLGGKAAANIVLREFASPFRNGISLYVVGFARNKTTLTRVRKTMEDIFSKHVVVKEEKEGKTFAKFWYQGEDGINSLTREIDSVPFDEIEKNYPENTQELQALMDMENPWEKGKIIFWHGPTGTGKTYALRALMSAWKDANPTFIMQPMAFLTNPTNFFPLIEDSSNQKTSLLVVLEDLPNVTASEARSNISTATALQTLLNMADGILGQGIPIIFLVTTNHESQEFDSALTRYGRCLQQLYFDKFSREQAVSWLGDDAAALDEEDKDEFALSELYAIKNRVKPVIQPKPKKKAGFLV